MRHFIRKSGALLLIALLSWPGSARTQAPRRWLADPTLLVPAKTIGSNGGLTTTDYILDIELVDRTTGWAIDIWGLLRFDGRFWRPFQNFGNRIALRTIDMRTATDGWLGGITFAGNAPPNIYLARFNGTEATQVAIARRDGGGQLTSGSIADIAVQSDGTAWAAGSVWEPAPGGRYGERPLLAFFDGSSWHDRTPGWWAGRLTSLSMSSPTEGWASGVLGVIGATGSDAARPVVVRLQNGTWTEEPLPALDAGGATEVEMRTVHAGAGGDVWALFVAGDARCPRGRLLHRSARGWSLVPGEGHGFRAITALGLLPGTNRGWASVARCEQEQRPAQRMRFDNGVLTPDTAGARLAPQVYALLSEETQWAAAGGAMLRYSDEALPTDRVAFAAPGARYFETTGHTLSGAFRQYYETHGLDLGDPGISDRESLALFGYPVSEVFTEINPDTGDLLEVQYFERARFEYHAGNPDPYKVLLGRLGAYRLMQITDNRLGSGRNPEQGAQPAGCDRYPETGYDLCPPFRAFWHGNGGLAVFGFPITQARDETSATDAKTYLTQWYERERLEYHPELRGTPYEVLLGLLAAEDLRLRGYLPNQ